MQTQSNPSIRFLLFPYTVLSEKQFRHASLLLPRLNLLHILRPSSVPEWGAAQFKNEPAISDGELLGKIDAYLKGFREMAAIQGAGGVLAAMAAEWKRPEVHESRFRIQSHLRGSAPQLPDPEELLLLEAAVFLELAADLDVREMDLEADLSGIGKLEDSFREILGYVDEEELKEFHELAAPPLPVDQGYLSYMLARRMGAWYRLYTAGTASSEPSAPVTMNAEVVEELADSIRSDWAHEGQDIRISRRTLASIPALSDLSAEAFLELRRELFEPGSPLDSFHREVERAVARMETSPESGGEMENAARALRDFLEDYCDRAGAPRQPGSRRAHLTLVGFDNSTHADFWKRLDSLGFELWEEEFSSRKPAPSVLCITEGE